MLRFLRIRNLALIRELELEFGEGLNLLTGETGSGKSILVDAFGLLLGERSSQEMIRSQCETAVLEGLFEIDGAKSLNLLLADAGFEINDNSLMIRREISSSGRNRVFINNSLTTLSLLKSIGEKLADIHGQPDQKSLLDLPTHLEWLDCFGGNAPMTGEIQEQFRKLGDLSRRLDSLQTNEQERLRRVDILKFQLNEIRSVNPRLQEQEELESEKTILSNREKILALTTEAYASLYESESSILGQANRLDRILQELESFDRSWASHREALRESRYRFEDLAYATRDYAARSDFSPERLEQVHQRLHALEKLLKKYGATIGDILQYADKCEKELEELVAHADTSSRLSEQLKEESDRYRQSATKLSEKRRKDSARLEKDIRREFSALSMERMELKVHFYPNEDAGTDNRIPSYYGLNGIDHVEFLIAPNKGEAMRPLAQIASGGELSRLLLSIKSVCRNKETETGKTLVFDEVDAGIGGRVAEAVGKRLLDLSDNNQVLCVTHLPQIAAFARHHFRVHKEVIDGRTETLVAPLNGSERIPELARMLGGEIITEATRKHAREMLEQSTGKARHQGRQQL